MKRVFGFASVVGMAILLLVGIGAARAGGAEQNPSAASGTTARSLIDQVTANAIAVLRDSKLTHDQQTDKLKHIADEYLDFTTMARMTLGRSWRDISDDKKAAFVKEFKEHLAITYGHTADSYSDEDVITGAQRSESNGDVTVQTKIVGKNNTGAKEDVAQVDYRLRQGQDTWKIIDVTIDGVSLVTNFRSQFSEIMANGGIDHLLQLLHDKNAAGEK